MFVNILFKSVRFVSHLLDPVMPTTGKHSNPDHNTLPKDSVKRNKQKKKVDPPQVNCLVLEAESPKLTKRKVSLATMLFL